MLEGKKAVVTGAAQGIGQAIAETLAQGGADVVIADLDAGRCQETLDRVKKHDRQALAVSTNIGNWEEVKALVDQVIKEWGRIDIFVNNAGITRDGLVVRMKEEDWNAVIQVNLTGTFYCIKAALGPMAKQRYGRIINMASNASKQASATGSAYSASKFAVLGLTQASALDLAPYQITVNAVCPGSTNTDRTDYSERAVAESEGVSVEEVRARVVAEAARRSPLGRMGESEDVANLVAFLVSDEASFITGQAYNVNGGILFH